MAGRLSVHDLALGIFVTVAFVGAVSVVAGRMLGTLGAVTNYLVAALLFVVGLELLGVWPLRWPVLPRADTTRRGLAGAFLFGLAFGTALGPCTFAFLAPVVGMTMRIAGTRPIFAMALMLASPVTAASSRWRAPAVRCWQATRPGANAAWPSCAAPAACWSMAGGVYLVYAAP